MMKNHYGIVSGYISATNGENILAVLQKTLHIPIEVAAMLTGKNVLLAINTVLKPPAIPNLPIKTYKEMRNC